LDGEAEECSEECSAPDRTDGKHPHHRRQA